MKLSLNQLRKIVNEVVLQEADTQIDELQSQIQAAIDLLSDPASLPSGATEDLDPSKDPTLGLTGVMVSALKKKGYIGSDFDKDLKQAYEDWYTGGKIDVAGQKVIKKLQVIRDERARQLSKNPKLTPQQISKELEVSSKEILKNLESPGSSTEKVLSSSDALASNESKSIKIKVNDLRKLIREVAQNFVNEVGEVAGVSGSASTDLSNPGTVKDIADTIAGAVAKGTSVKNVKNIRPGKKVTTFDVPTGAGAEVLNVQIKKD